MQLPRNGVHDNSKYTQKSKHEVTSLNALTQVDVLHHDESENIFIAPCQCHKSTASATNYKYRKKKGRNTLASAEASIESNSSCSLVRTFCVYLKLDYS